MAGIYKHGFPEGKDHHEAATEALDAIRAAGDDDPVIEGPSLIQADDHKAAGEYLVRIVTGQPGPASEPQTPAVDPIQAEREQLLARLAELDAVLGD